MNNVQRVVCLLVVAIAAMSILAPAVALADETPTPELEDDPTPEPTPESNNESDSNESTTPTPEPTPTPTPEPTPEPDDGPDTEASTPSDRSLTELRRNGKLPGDSPPSVRLADEQMYWVVHWPADTWFAQPGDPEDKSWRYLRPDDTVDRNNVWLRSIRTESGTQEQNVTIVLYETRLNTTSGDQEVVNVRERQQSVEFGPGWSMERIRLGTNEDETHVLMYFEDSPEEARWTFKHESIATSEPIAISTWGDFLKWSVGLFVIPTIFGTFVTGFSVRSLLRKAAIGPQWGYQRWAFVLFLTTVAVVWWQLGDFANLVVTLPLIIAAYTVAIIGIVMLETYESDIRRALFLQPNTTEAVSPSGKDQVSFQQAEMQEEHIVSLPDGGLAVVRPGLLPFIARAFGGAAILENADKIKSRVRVNDSKWQEMFFVHSDAEMVLDYKPERLWFQIPDIDGWKDAATTLAIPAGATLLIASSVHAAFGGFLATLVVLGAGALLFVCPEDGYARIKPAPAHMQSAYASMMFLEKEEKEADTLDKARRENVTLRARSEKEIEEELSKQDSTLIREMHSNVDLNKDPDQETVIDTEAAANGHGGESSDE